MRPKQLNPGTLIAWTLIISLSAFGCGGHATSASSTQSRNGPGTPAPGIYLASFQPSETGVLRPASALGETPTSGTAAASDTGTGYAGAHTAGALLNTGTILVSVDSKGTLSVAASDSASDEDPLVGSTTIGSDDSFSATLASSTGTSTITGTTYARQIQLSLTGTLEGSTNVTAKYIGMSNPMASNYTGTVSGGDIGSGQHLYLAVADISQSNVSGSMTTSGNGTLPLTGSLTPIGVFTATAPVKSPGKTINLTGTFMYGIGGKLQGSGTWTDSWNPKMFGTWAVNSN